MDGRVAVEETAMLLVILPVVSLVTFIPTALVLIAVVALRLVSGFTAAFKPARPGDLDEMAARVVTRVAVRKIYKSQALKVVPVLGRPGAFHVVTGFGRHERMVTAMSLAVVHTLVIAHLAAQYA